LYHEAVCANLLERLLLCGDGVEAASEDALFELADYGVRSVRCACKRRRGAAAARAPRAPASRCAHTRAARQAVHLTHDGCKEAVQHERCVQRTRSLPVLAVRP
jgi:hypothetical protein